MASAWSPIGFFPPSPVPIDADSDVWTLDDFGQSGNGWQPQKACTDTSNQAIGGIGLAGCMIAGNPNVGPCTSTTRKPWADVGTADCAIVIT